MPRYERLYNWVHSYKPARAETATGLLQRITAGEIDIKSLSRAQSETILKSSYAKTAKNYITKLKTYYKKNPDAALNKMYEQSKSFNRTTWNKSTSALHNQINKMLRILSSEYRTPKEIEAKEAQRMANLRESFRNKSKRLANMSDDQISAMLKILGKLQQSESVASYDSASQLSLARWIVANTGADADDVSVSERGTVDISTLGSIDVDAWFREADQTSEMAKLGYAPEELALDDDFYN